jgi:hypothetical protein
MEGVIRFLRHLSARKDRDLARELVLVVEVKRAVIWDRKHKLFNGV